MTEAQAVEAIYEAWIAGWAAHEAAVPTKFGNEAALASDRWCRITVTPSVRQQGSMGGPGTRRFENRGYVAVQLFVPVDEGDAELRGLCDVVRTALETASLVVGGESVSTFGAVTANIGTDGRWYFATVTVPMLWFQQR